MDEGLRERKKRETRQAISDVATRLFQERGFENVSVNEIAAAANVSKMTVFNYFARKEDLYFDRGSADFVLVAQALRKGAPLASLRALVHEMVEQKHVQVRITPAVSTFWRAVKESPALRARARELRDELENELTRQLQDAGLANARLVASMLVAGFRVAYTTALRRHRAGDSAASVRDTFLSTIDQAFELLGVRPR